MFFVIETEQVIAITVQDSRGGNHFCIKQNIVGKQAQEIARMPIRTIHHRRDTKSPIDDSVNVNLLHYYIPALSVRQFSLHPEH